MTDRCILVGVPVHEGTGIRGCEIGPAAYRAAGLSEVIRDLGISVEDRGDVAPAPRRELRHPNPSVHGLAEIDSWARALRSVATEAAHDGMPIFLGGDHSLSVGSIAGMAALAAKEGRPFFVLWLDAHPDFHTLETTASGNLHGTPMAYLTNRPGFSAFLPALESPVDPRHVCMIGLRSVDAAERAALVEAGVTVHDMRALDEAGMRPLLQAFLDRVAAANGVLHVSLDVDFLDPGIAPGVGTASPGGATYREAHLAMEMLHDSGLVRSLDLVELNPLLDERGRTAHLMIDLAASLLGRRISDRQPRI